MPVCLELPPQVSCLCCVFLALSVSVSSVPFSGAMASSSAAVPSKVGKPSLALTDSRVEKKSLEKGEKGKEEEDGER